MSITINGLTLNSLQAQPFAYEGSDASKGLIARSWTVSGLVTSSELADFKSIFDTWRAARRSDPDSLKANSVGTTVGLSASANGLTASGVACWFTDAPAFEQVGRYIQLTATLVDANEALTVAKATVEKQVSADKALLPEYGTVTLGGVTITLTEQMEGLDNLPTLARTPAGYAYLTGSKQPSRIRTITGTVANEAAFTTLCDWVISSSQATPEVGDWFPTAPPTASAEVQVVNGLKTTVWTVTITVEQV